MRLAVVPRFAALAGVIFVLLLPPALAETPSGVGLVPLSYHPYPDKSDPFGLPTFSRGDQAWDYFQARYSVFDTDRNGFSFPSMVVDGVQFIEGVPEGSYEGTFAAYQEAFEARRVLETPVTMILNGTLKPDQARFEIRLQSAADLATEPLAVKWALVEDDVYYKPPPALSNGVFVHRFTIRALNPFPAAEVSLAPDRPWSTEASVPLGEGWNRDHLYVAAWVQNDNEAGHRYKNGEVVQASLHFFRWSEPTVQTQRGVLMEIYTATWCPACLFGDNALHTLANEHGLRSTLYREPRWQYVPSPDVPAFASGIGLGFVLALVALPSRGPLGLARLLRRRRL